MDLPRFGVHPCSHEVLTAADSHNVQMIVMGTRGLSGLDHIPLGSVTEQVIRKAGVPLFWR